MRFFLIFFMMLWGIQHIRAAPLKILTSFTILKDFVEQVGREHVQVDSIVGPNADAHVFEPTPETGKKLLRAQLLVVNGLGFEGWMDRLTSASGYKGDICVASQTISARTLAQDKKITQDPHAWMSVPHARIYVDNITNALCKADPIHCADFQKNAKEYDTKLEVLDQHVRTLIKDIPPEKRLFITAHDAFSYFAQTYGVKVLAPMGISTLSEPSAWNVAALIDQIRALKVKTIFVENMANPKLMQQISQETGARIGDTLYSDALSTPEGPAPTYLALMNHNMRLLASAMME
jgi:zinc/manganese transport system substrate-binding protein